MAGYEMTVGARHRFSALDRAFRYQKVASRSLYQAHIRDLDQDINRLCWSDQGFGADLAPIPAQYQYQSS